MTNQKTSFLKAKIKDYALSSFKSCNEKSAISTLNKDEIFALKTLSENKDLIIETFDKDNSIVLTNKSDYLDKMCNILSDSRKSVKSSAVDDKRLNFIDEIEKKLKISHLKNEKHQKLFQKLIAKNLKQEFPVFVFYMAFRKLITWQMPTI